MNKNRKILTAIFIASTIGTSVSYASSFNDVNVNLDGVSYEYRTRENTVMEFLEKENIKLKNGDQIDAGLNDKIEDDMDLNIQTEKTINFNGKDYKTSKIYVKDFLKEIGKNYTEKAFKNFKANDKIKEGMKLDYKETKSKIYSVEVPIKKEQDIEYDNTLNYGEKKFIEGREGIKKLSKKMIVNNVEVIDDSIIKEDIIKKPVNDKKIIGSREEVEKSIEFNTVEEIDYSLEQGIEKVTQEGSNGLKKVVYDRRKNSKKVIDEKIVKEPRDKIIVKGGKTVNTSSNNISTSNSGNYTSIYSNAKEEIAKRESGGSYSATNGRYIGRYQLDYTYLNGDYSPENQERVADNYVAGRYGSWDAALDFWNRNGWY